MQRINSNYDRQWVAKHIKYNIQTMQRIALYNAAGRMRYYIFNLTVIINRSERNLL